MYYSENHSLENELVMEALISGDDIKLSETLTRFKDDMDPHKICRNGISIACAAVKTGNLDILKTVLGDTSDEGENQRSQKRLKTIEFPLRDPSNFGCFYRTNFEIESSSEEAYGYTLKTRGNISHLDNFGRNALHYAVLLNHVEMVEYLLTSFKDLNGNQFDINMNSPLHIAVAKDNLQMVKLLLRSGSSVHLKDSEGKTPLHIASERGSTDMISTLLDAGADVNALDHRGQSTLILATIYNHCSAVELLIKRGVRVNYEDDQGFTALKRAVFVKNSKVTKILVEHGARICESLHLLHYATVYNQKDIIESLLNGGARLESRNIQGNTPLMLAIEYRNLEMVEFLLEKGADPNNVNSHSGTTSLHVSMFYIKEAGAIEPYLDLLCKYGADLYKRCNYGFDALYYAFLHKNDPAACHLIRRGMDVNFRHKLADYDYMTGCIRHSMTKMPITFLMYAGFKLKNYETKPITDKNYEMNEKEKYLQSFFERKFGNFWSLRYLCRFYIRRCVKYDDISKLPIPNCMQKFLKMENIY